MNPAGEFCGGDVVFLNGQPLTSLWDEVHAEGDGNIYFQASSPPVFASWQILCLSGGVDTSNVDGVQAISFVIDHEDRAFGFTISYQAYPTPRIFRFDPHPISSESILENGLFWRTPSTSMREISRASPKDRSKTTSTSANNRQKSLSFHSLGDLIGAKVAAVKKAADEALLSCRHHFPGIHSMFNKLSHDISTLFCSRRQESSHALQHFIYGNSQMVPDTTLIPAHKPSQTPHDIASSNHDEDLDTHNSLPPSTSHAMPHDSSHLSGDTYSLPIADAVLDESNQTAHQVKTLGLAIVLMVFFISMYRWLKDPRRRADCAARREEWRRRRLYRRAARIQKLRNFFGIFRRQYCPLYNNVRNWDEKQVLVLQQEEILETVMKEEIHALRRAYHMESAVVAAEEGRNDYVYEGDSRSERRRSMATLPGYESEGTQPPGYESDTISVSDGVPYTPVDSEDTPDSSVISTSPRISRDGRDSDFEKEVVSDWALEFRPLYGFRSVDE